MAQRLLIIELHLLGDAVMSLPFLRGAQQNYEVHVAASPAAARVYELVLPPERIHQLEMPARGFGGGKGWTNFWTQIRLLRELHADVVTSVWADTRVHLSMRLMGIPRRIGFPMNAINYYATQVKWRQRQLKMGERMRRAIESPGIRLLTESLQRKDYRQHHVEDWAQLAEALGFVADTTEPWLDARNFPFPEKARPFFERNAGKKIWLLHPGAGKITKQWPRFSEVGRDFFGAHAIPLVIIEDPAVPRIEPPHDNCLAWPMSTLADLIALTGGCDFVLCNDSAAAHIGAALKKHVVTIFGSGSSDWFRAYTERSTIIESSICPYRPCLDRCLQPSIICLEDISVQRVVGELEKLTSR